MILSVLGKKGKLLPNSSNIDLLEYLEYSTNVSLYSTNSFSEDYYDKFSNSVRLLKSLITICILIMINIYTNSTFVLQIKTMTLNPHLLLMFTFLLVHICTTFALLKLQSPDLILLTFLLQSLDGIFSVPYLSFGGDLNLTFGASEVWGDKARVEPLRDYFNNHEFSGLWTVIGHVYMEK